MTTLSTLVKAGRRSFPMVVLVCLAAAVSLPASAAGTGAFSPHPTMPSFGAGHSTDVALGDLDGDSDLDAVVANDFDQPETVWLNDGTGTFRPDPTSAA